jgi:hypothetical protein
VLERTQSVRGIDSTCGAQLGTALRGSLRELALVRQGVGGEVSPE